MKKIYTTMMMCLAVFGLSAQYGQIPNGGFENWTNTTLYDYLNVWGSSNEEGFSTVETVFKSTDAQQGTYSAEITSQLDGLDTLFGYVYQGRIGNNGPDAGIPYPSTFNTVKFQYKSDLPLGDSLYLLIIRFSGGNSDMIITPVASGTHSTWTQASISIANTPQDSLFIAFIAGEPFNGIALTPGAWARIDNVQLFNGATQQPDLPDFGFENWSSQTSELPDNWYTYNDVLAHFGFENAVKTTDANTGNFAIEMTHLEDTTNGNDYYATISLGPVLNGNPLVPYVASPTTFSGAYKFSSIDPNDASAIYITFYANSVAVGSHYEQLDPVASYTTFTSPLTISATPDSIEFVVYGGNEIGSVLKLDDLSFSGGNVGVEEFASMNASIYPNPATSEVMVKAAGNYTVELVELTGKVVYISANQFGVQTIDVSSLHSGTYFVRLSNGTTSVMNKLVIE